MRGRTPAAFGHRYADRFRNDRRIVGHMIVVAEHELKRMHAERKRDLCLRLPGAEMEVIWIVRDRFVD